jgi:SAM-dependent methyltransferase
MNKVNLGCGTDIRPGYVNVEAAALPGVDVTHDLSVMPWPFENGQFREAILINVVEHLPNTVAVVEEVWRILDVGGKAIVRVPYWSCKDTYIDPTHVKGFHQKTFDFFDPGKYHCQKRPYVSHARFRIERIYYYTKVGPRFFKIGNRLGKAFLGALATYLSNIIWVLEFELVKLDPSVHERSQQR